MPSVARTSAFALNLVLGARLRPVEALFGGLDRMYDAHRTTGKVAFSLLLGHVVLIVASRATISTGTALDLLGPGAGRTVFAGVLAFSAMTVAIVLTLFVRLGHEVFVYVHRVIGIAYLVAALHIFGTPGTPLPTPVTLYLALLTVLGLAIGLIGAFLVTRVLAGVLFGVSPTDPPSYIGISLVLFTVGLVASYVPARRAAKVQPAVALRYE